MAETLTTLLTKALESRGNDILFDSSDNPVSCEQILTHAEETRAFFARKGSSVVLFRADHAVGSRALYLSLLLSGITAAPVHASTPRNRLEAIASRLATADIVTAPTDRLAPLREHDFTPISVQPHANPARGGDSEAPAYILHTSGSTGNPKGVPIPGGALKAYLEFITSALKWRPGGRFSANFDLSFDLALHDLLVPILTQGVSCLSHPKLAALPHRYVEDRGISEWFSVPGAATLARKAGSLRPGSLRGLDKSLFCGEALATADAQYWAAATETAVFNLYGPTEMTLAATMHEFAGDPYPTVPIGRAFDHLRAKKGSLRDPDELLLTGVQMFAGYVDPADDADAFETDHEGVRWYRTGDRVRPSDSGGYLFHGRLDTQVKVAGHRVDLMDVEHAFRTDPNVAEAVAFLDPSTQRLCVALQLRDDTAGRTPSQWREFATGRLPRYMHPAQVFTLADIPRNRNGKVDRAKTALKAATREPAGATGGADRSGGVS